MGLPPLETTVLYLVRLSCEYSGLVSSLLTVVYLGDGTSSVVAYRSGSDRREQTPTRPSKEENQKVSS
jgi:hypothetical protein